jgi:hypothetical protein
MRPTLDLEGLAPHLGHWLTQEEFKVVWTYQWVAYLTGRMGVESMSDSEREGVFGTITTAFDWSIRELAHKGLKFTGIEVLPNGTLELSKNGPVEIRNELLLIRLRKGKALHPVHNLRFTIDYLTARDIAFDRKTFEEVLAQARSDQKTVHSMIAEDERRMYVESIEYLLRVAGLQKASES